MCIRDRLAAPQNNLFVVGDDDQSIYGFRGADSRLMFQFQKDFPDAKQLLLDVNYRSSENIVKNSLKVIANNEVRFDKKIRAWKESGETLHVPVSYTHLDVYKRQQKRMCIWKYSAVFPCF